jgi:hypothetical protein
MRPVLSRFPAALALLLWFGATFYLHGDTGKHSDDYHAHLVNAATGAVDLSLQPWNRWKYFWRPVHLAHVTGINTISYDHPWIGHLELALAHGAVGWMLAGLLTRLGIRRSVAGMTALLFVTLPLVGEASLWTSASCNVISCLFLLRGLELARRQTAGPASRARILWIALLTFVAACWYEPAAAAMAAAPFVYLAACPSGVPLRNRLRGAVALLLAAGLACLLYTTLLLLTAPPQSRGGSESLTTPATALTRIAQVLRLALNGTFGLRGQADIQGSIEQGWGVLRHVPGPAFLAAAIALAVGTVLVLASRAHRIPPAAGITLSARGLGLLMVAGGAMIVGGLVPLIAINRNGVELRTLYVPLLGITLIFATFAGATADRIAQASAPVRTIFAALASSAGVTAAIMGMIGMIGFQAQFRLNAANDRLICENLRALAPNPAPGTMFVPLRIKMRGASTSQLIYNRALHGALEAPWCSSAIVRSAFKRRDIACTCVPYWANGRLPIMELDADGLVGNGLTIGADIGNDGRAHVPWKRCIPFVVEPGGNVRLVQQATIQDRSGEKINILFPRTPPDTTARPPLIVEIIEDAGGVRAKIRGGNSSPDPDPMRD